MATHPPNEAEPGDRPRLTQGHGRADRVREVALVRWPEEADAGAEAVARGMAVLYLVRAAAPAPVPSSPLEDWIRLPADERDLDARLAVLERRAAEHAGPPGSTPTVGSTSGARPSISHRPRPHSSPGSSKRPGAEVSDEELGGDRRWPGRGGAHAAAHRDERVYGRASARSASPSSACVAAATGSRPR